MRKETLMKYRLAKKIAKNEERYHPHQIQKAGTVLSRRERRMQTLTAHPRGPG